MYLVKSIPTQAPTTRLRESIGWLLLLAACAPRPTPSPPTKVTCPQAEVPAVSCPACPEVRSPVCPKPPPAPEYPDWYCHDLHRKNRPVSSYCLSTTRACEESRLDFIKHKAGKKVGHCTPQTVAHCFQLTVPYILSRQYLCANTADNCARRRSWYRKNRPSKYQRVSLCEAVRNTDPYYPRDDEPFSQPSDIVQ